MRARVRAGLGAVLFAAAGCSRGSAPAPGAAGADATTPLTRAVPVVVQPTVVAFWLRGSDTIPRAEARAARTEYLRLVEEVSKYLSDTDVQFAPVEDDTIVVQLAGGIQRIIMLTGLDYPYGFVLIDPGYAEEFHTGLDLLEDLEDAIVDYFGLDDGQREARPKHRIAISGFRPHLVAVTPRRSPE